MKKRLLALGVIAALAVGLMACTPEAEEPDKSSEEPKEPVYIGAVLSLTGTYAGLGEPEKNTIEMELERINEAGGINGREVKVIIEDDATEAQNAAAKATKLIDQDKVVAILGASGTGQTLALRGEAEKAEVPVVSMAGGSAVLEPFSKWVFQTPWPNRIVVPFVLENIKADGFTKIAVISDSGAYGKDGLAVIQKEAPTAGIEIVANETFNVGDTDMSAQLTRIKGSGAQAILLWSAGREAAIVVKNREQLAIELPMYGGSGNARAEFIAGTEAAGEGFRFGTGKVLLPEETYEDGSEPYRVATEFANRYKERYGKAPDIFAAHAYDALHLVVEAAKRIEGDITGPALRDEIEKTEDWVGLDGTFTYTAEDHNGLSKDDMAMYEIKDGKWVVAE